MHHRLGYRLQRRIDVHHGIERKKPEPSLPSDIPNLIAWFDSNAITGKNDGDDIETWLDQSGNGNYVTQPTFLSRPKYRVNIVNGRPIVRFDGADASMQSSDFVRGELTQPYAVIMAFKHRAPSTWDYMCDGNADANRTIIGIRGSTNTWSLMAGQWIDGGTPNTSWHILLGIINGGSSVLREDGVQVGSGDTGSHAIDGVTLGSDNDQVVGHTQLDLMHWMAYDKLLSPAETDVIESFLAEELGISI